MRLQKLKFVALPIPEITAIGVLDGGRDQCDAYLQVFLCNFCTCQVLRKVAAATFVLPRIFSFN